MLLDRIASSSKLETYSNVVLILSTHPHTATQPISCIALLLYVSGIHFASSTSLFILQTEMVVICKCNPPLTSQSCQHSPYNVCAAVAVDIFSEFLPTSSAGLPACIYLFMFFFLLITEPVGRRP